MIFFTDENLQLQLEAELQVHKKQAAAFCDLLRDDDNDLFLCSLTVRKPTIAESAEICSLLLTPVIRTQFTIVIGNSNANFTLSFRQI